MVSRGLAWFSRQIPSEGFSDLSQGRAGETEVPHSDQWVDNIGHNDSYRPDKFNRVNVLKGKNSRGDYTKIIEELYQQDEAFYESKMPIHNATYEAGRYTYQYPSGFENAHTENKAIAIRRIETIAADYYVTIQIVSPLDDNGDTCSGQFNVLLPSSYSLHECMSAINLESRKSLVIYKGAAPVAEEKAELVFQYDMSCFLKVRLRNMTKDATRAFQFGPNTNDDFLALLNVPLANRERLLGTVAPELTFPNVWDRKNLFLHASFVSNTTANYLGRGGEFYEVLGKIYQYDGQKYFYIETSFDGYNRVPLYHENFVLELAFILDSK
jgi:hypothetical protein